VNGLKARFVILGCVLAACAGASLYAGSVPERAASYFRVSDFPRVIEGWSSRECGVENGTREILETDAVLVREFTDGSGVRIGLVLVYYPSEEKVALHLPESCLLGHGSRLSDRGSAKIRRGAQGDFPCMKLVTESGAGKSRVLYYFQTGRYHTGSYLDFRATMLMRQLSGRREGGALVRFSAAAEPGVADERCERALEEFAAAASLAVDRCMP
jgi:EpsI family protein